MAPSSCSRRLLVLAGLVLLPVVAACNALLGIDDYDKVECTGGSCDGGVTTDGPNEADRPDVVLLDAAGAGPVSWARFKMPNYPYDAGPDAKVDNPFDYEDAGGGIHDRVTGLVWQEPVDKMQRSFADARNACTDGWRLPTRIELITLLDLSTNMRRTDERFAASTQQIEYWTTSEVRPFTDRRHWTVNFNPTSSDVLGQRGEDQPAGVRCVKGQ